MASLASYKVQDVPGDGNCFYWALFYAAKDSKCLKKMTSIFQGKGDYGSSCMVRDDIPNESDVEALASFFVLCSRMAVAEAIIPEATGMYKNLVEKKTTDNATYVRMLEDQPSWIATAINQNTPLNVFIQTAKENVTKPGTWVGHLEVSVIKSWLRKGGINLVVTNGPTVSQPPNNTISIPQLNWGEDQYGNTYLNLYNENTIHYKFILNPGGPSATGGSRKKQSTKASVSKRIVSDRPASRKAVSNRPTSKKAPPSTTSKKAASPPTSKKVASPPTSKKVAPRPPAHSKHATKTQRV
jgi:hypothetical protein